MLVEIIWDREAKKALKKMDKSTADRIIAKVEQLSEDESSLAQNIKPLKGIENTFRLRVGDWRVIYCFEDDRLVLLVLKIGARGGVYK